MKIKVISIVGRQAVKIASQGKFWACKHAPELLQAAGVAGFAGTCALVKKGAEKGMDIHEDACYERLNTPADDKQARKEIKRKETSAIIKAYAPAVICGMGSIGCFTGGHYILKKRYIGIACAYKVIDESYKNYRSNVVAKYGEEEDFRLKNNIRIEKENIVEIDEDGKKHKKKVDVNIVDDEPTGYAIIYDDQHCLASVTNAVIARDNLVMAENNANRKLKATGYILLNDVLRGLGMHETSAGAIVGWQLKGNGDGYVHFDVKQIRTAMDPEGVAFLVDFNVDGPIYQDIDKYNRLWGEQ